MNNACACIAAAGGGGVGVSKVMIGSFMLASRGATE